MKMRLKQLEDQPEFEKEYQKMVVNSTRDVTLVTQEMGEGEGVKVHRSVLITRSSIFSEIFSSTGRDSTTESTTEVVHIPDFSKQAVQNFVDFLYQGCIENGEQ